jgi:hypothetical protein
MMQAAPLAWFVVAVLGVFRVTHLLWTEDGPWDFFTRLRRAVAGSFFGRMLDCFYCASLWVALPFAVLLVSGMRERTLLWLGLSGGAVLLQKLTAGAAPRPAVEYFEGPAPSPTPKSPEDIQDDLLRKPS